MTKMIRKILPVLCILCFAAVACAAQKSAGDFNLAGRPACTSFCLVNNGYAIYGANYDQVRDCKDGLVFVNKRNMTKSFGQPDSFSNHASWTSKYGSVSFNLISAQAPWGGMNEAGLAINLLRLEGSQAPEPDKRPWIASHYYLQYILDNFSSVEEVIASDSSLRIVNTNRVPHYFLSDRFGHCAVIEFIEGKMVAYSGDSLPLNALANTSYRGSLTEWNQYTAQKAEGKRVSPAGSSSQTRFIHAAERAAAFRPTDTQAAVDTAFDILACAGSQKANWSIVFDARNLRAYFKTIVHSDVRMIDFRKLDFSCQSPVTMLDVNEKLSGDITGQLKDYSFELHYRHALRAAENWKLDMPPDELQKLIRCFDDSPCN